MSPDAGQNGAAPKVTNGHDPWASRTAPAHLTRSSLLASRRAVPKLADDEVAGGAPVPLDPANRIDKSTLDHPPLDAARVNATSRAALLQRRKVQAADQEQSTYDRWDENNAIWEVPKFGLSEDWVAQPKHVSLSQIKAEELRAKRAACNMNPERIDPKFDLATAPASTVYVHAPRVRTLTELRQSRAAEQNADQQRKLRANSGKKNARQRLLDREDQFVAKQQSVPAGKSRNQMRLQRRQDSIEYERAQATKKSSMKECVQEKWANKTGEKFWESDSSWNEAPRHRSATAMFTEKRVHLKPERYNVYKDPDADPFKSEYHKKPRKRTDDDLVINAARIQPFRKSALVQQLRNLRSRDNAFTDYQLYFQTDHTAPSSSADPSEDDPLYSSFTKDKIFDPNTGLPRRLHGKHGGTSPDSPHSSPSPTLSTHPDDEEDDSWDPDMPEGCSWTPSEREVLIEPEGAQASVVRLNVEAIEMRSKSTRSTPKSTSRSNDQKPQNNQTRNAEKPQRPWTAATTRPGHLWNSNHERRVTARPGTAVVRSGGWQNILCDS